MRDDLAQQLARVIDAEVGDYYQPVGPVLEDIARAVLASGLVVPTSDVLNLAQQREHLALAGDLTAQWFVANLRALTQQENR